MKSIALAVYLLIGLLIGHYHIQKVSNGINAEIEDGDISEDSQELIDQSEELSSWMGHKNLIALLYLLFAVVWLPAIIYINFPFFKSKEDKPDV